MSAVLFVREDLLKASHYKTITVPGHVHGGKWVNPYQKKVLVSNDHNDLNVASGFGSFYQKQAHKKLAAELDSFHTMHPQDKAAVILAHATELQLAASASAAVSGFKASILAGKVPTTAQYLAMQNAPANVQSKVADACAAAIGDEKYEQLLSAASAKANQTKGKANEPQAAQTIETSQKGQAQGTATAEPAEPAKAAEPAIAGQAAVTDDTITVPAMLGKIGPTTFKPAPDFANYAEAQAWMAARAKALGMSKADFQSSHEFHYAYPKIKAAYVLVKKEFDDKKAETGAVLVADMNAAGVKLWDTVAWTMTGAFLSANHYEGKVVMHGGVPHVKLAHEVAVTKPGGKIGYTKFLQWAPYMKVKGAPVAVADAPIVIKKTNDGVPIKPRPPAFASTLTDLENWIEDGNIEQLKDAVFNLTGLTSVSAKAALAYAEAGVRYLEKKAQAASGPKDGDTKSGADGAKLVFKNGRWHKYVDADESGELPPVLVPVDDAADSHKAAVTAMEGGAFYQKEAIKKLKAEHGPAWHAMHPTKQHELAQAKYQALQGAASQAAAVSGWKKHMLAGQVPTPSEVKAMAAFDTANPSKAVLVMNDVQGVIGLDKYVQLVTQAHAKAAKASAATVKPAEPAKVFVTTPPADAQVTQLTPEQIAGLHGWMKAGKPTSKHPDSWSNLWKKLSTNMKGAVIAEMSDADLQTTTDAMGSSPLADWTALTDKHWGDIQEFDDIKPFLKDPKLAGPVALMAFSSGSFIEINESPDSPEAKAVLDYVAKLPVAKDKKIHRVLGFMDASAASAFVASLSPVGKPNTQERTLSSWTNKDPAAPGQTPMNNIALDLASAGGDHQVFLTLDGQKTGKDISFVYSKDGSGTGTEIVLSKGAKLEVTGVVHKGKQTHVTVREVQEGDTKVAGGVTYVLQGGRWHKQGVKAAAAPKPVSLADKPAYDHLAHAETDGGVHKVMIEAKAWLAANPGKESELNQAVVDLGYSGLKVPVPGAADGNAYMDKFNGNDEVQQFIIAFKLHGTKSAVNQPIDVLLDPPEIAAFEKLSTEDKMDVAAAISFYGPHKLNLFMGWVSAQAAKKHAQANATTKVMSQVFMNTTPGHNKFWSVSTHGNVMKTTYGKIGTMGSTTTKEFASPSAAGAAAAKLIYEKKAKGYKLDSPGTHEYEHKAGAPAAPVLPPLVGNVAGVPPAVKDEFDKLVAQGDFPTLHEIYATGGLKAEVKNYLESLLYVKHTGPDDGDTKLGVDGGTLVFKNGHWHKQGIVVPDFSDDASMWNGIYAKAAAELKAAFESGGTAAVKELITVHKVGNKAGKFSANLGGGKFSVGPNDTIPRRVKMYAFIKAMLDANVKAGKKVAFTTAAPGAVPKPAAAPAAAAPKPAKPSVSMPTVKIVAGKPPVSVIDGWTQTGPQKGSNPGGKFKDKNGQEWYCKFPADVDVAMNELLAAKFYQMLGVSVPNLKLVEQGGKIGIASKWVDGISKGTSDQLAKAPGAHQAFALDAWLANWDVVGLSNDNLMLDKGGAAVRVDVGGSLVYRAQGGAKGADFGDTVPELETLLDASKNGKSAAVFGKIKKGDMAWGLTQLNKMKPSQIEELCQKAGPGSDADKAALAKRLIARRAFILAKMGVRDQWAHVKALDPTKLPVNPKDLPKPIDFANLNGPGKGLSSKAHVNAQNTLDSANMIAFAAKGNLTALKNYQYDAVDKESGAALGKKSIIDHPSSQIKNQWAGLIETLQSISTPPLDTLKMPSLGAAGTEAEMSQLAGTFNPLDRVETVAAEHRMGFFMAVSQIDDVQDLVGGYKWSYLTPTSKFVEDAKAGFSKLSSSVRAYIGAVQASGWINHVWSQGKPTVDASGNGGSYSGGVQTLSAKIYADALEIPEGTTLTRGMTDKTAGKSMTQQLLNATPGLVIQNTDSMCTSYKEGWGGFDGGVVLTIRCGKGCKGTPSFASGHFGSEQEITTLPGQRFVVLSVGKKGSSAHVELFMLPPHEGYVEELGKLEALGKAMVVFFKRGK